MRLKEALIADDRLIRGYIKPGNLAISPRPVEKGERQEEIPGPPALIGARSSVPY